MQRSIVQYQRLHGNNTVDDLIKEAYSANVAIRMALFHFQSVDVTQLSDKELQRYTETFTHHITEIDDYILAIESDNDIFDVLMVAKRWVQDAITSLDTEIAQRRKTDE
jgi:hypothetical protein